MQRLEVSGAVRHIYIYIYVIRRLKVKVSRSTTVLIFVWGLWKRLVLKVKREENVGKNYIKGASRCVVLNI
jgi:hypothetical protein